MKRGERAKQNKEQKKEEEMHSLKRIARGAGIVLVGMALGKVIGYFYTMLAARLGTEKFGLLNLGFSVVSLFVIASLLGLDSGVLRYVSYYEGKKDRSKVKGTIISSFKICVPLSIFFAIIMFLFAPQIAIFLFHNNSLIPILRIFAFSIPFSVAATLIISSFRAFQRVEYQVGLNEIVEKAARLLATFILLYLGFGIIGAAWSYLFSAFVVFILSIFILEKKVFPVFTLKIKAEQYNRELLSYSIPLMFSAFLIFIIAWANTLMLGYFRTASEVGIYNVAYPTSSLIFVLPTALISLFLPVITGFYSQKRHGEIKKLYKRVSRWVFFVNFPIFLVIAVFSRQIIKILFGRDYITGAAALTILVIGHFIYSLSYTSSNILSMVKKTKVIFIISLIFAGSNLVLNYFFIPLYGVNGAAIATSISFVIGTVLIIFFTFKLTRIYPFDRFFLKSFLAGILSIVSIYYIAPLLFGQLSFFRFALIFLIFLFLYLGLLFLFRSFEKEDFGIIKAIISEFMPNKQNFYRVLRKATLH